MALMRFLTEVPRMGKGDWVPFCIVAATMLLAAALPEPVWLVMPAIAVCWLAFVTVGLLMNAKSLRAKRDDAVARGAPAGVSILQMWALFNIPTVLVLLVSFWRW